MEKNTCELCLKKFKTKFEYTRHLQRLTPCNKDKPIPVINTEGNNNVSIIGDHNINGNNNKVTIIINTYGEENTDYLTDKHKSYIISKCFGSIAALIEQKHFNPKHPENYNVYTSNYKTGLSYYYNGVNWVQTFNKELIEEMQLNNLYEVKNIFKELKENGKLDEQIIQSFENFLKEKPEKIEKEQEKYMKDNIKNLLYSKREEVIKLQKMMKK
jgi:hypothetical protein